MAKERHVTRTVIDSKTYQIYSMEGTDLKPLKTIETKGKVSERELEKELGVKKVVIVPIKENKITYGMTVDEFMKYAKVLDEQNNDLTEETDENED